MKKKEMLDEYDFSRSKKNSYINKLKKSITIRLDSDTIEYFKKLSDDSGIPYQTLINQFLAKCAKDKKKPEIVWQ